MLNQFCRETARAITSPVSARNRSEGLVNIGVIVRQLIEEMKPVKVNAVALAIQDINRLRARIKQCSNNESLIYELCKRVYELAELEHVDFNGAGCMRKLKFIRQLVPFASPSAVSDGVTRYHDSRVDMQWQMKYLSQENEQKRDVMKA